MFASWTWILTAPCISHQWGHAQSILAPLILLGEVLSQGISRHSEVQESPMSISTWSPICIMFFCSGFDSEIPTRPHVLKFKVFEFLIFMHSKWARRQLPGTVTKWSKFHQFTSIYNEQGKSDRPKIIKLTFFQFAAVCGNLRSFCGFLRSFCGVQFLRLRPKKRKTFLARATLVESRLAQIALQGPCTMQNWKTYAISEDLCVWHVLGIWDRCSKCGTICKCTKKCYERGYR